MDTSKLNLSSLRDKISSKLNNAKDKSSKGKKSKPVDQNSKYAGKDQKKGTKKNSKIGNNKDVIPKTKDSTKKSSESIDQESEEIIRKEALALGATDEDLALIADIDEGEESEQEFNDDSKTDKLFSADLSKFMQDIGLDGMQPETPESEDEIPELVKEDEEQVDEEEEEDDEEEEEEEDEEEEEEEDEKIAEESSQSVSDSNSGSNTSSSDSSSDSDSDSDSDAESENEQPARKNTQDEPDKVTNVNSVDSTKLLIPNRTDWYNIALGPVTNVEKLDRFGRERVYERGQRIVEQENKTYLEEFASNNSQKKFLSQILSDGTLNDKISALTLLIQEAPLHNIKALDSLMSYCDKKSRTASLQSINALKDLLLNGILPDRKLIAFEKQELSRTLTDTQCAIYYFEDYLKKAYFKLVGILEKLSHDPIVHVKMNVLSHIFDLLKAKPEQEANLLRLGVNKLGDIDNKVASKASYQILQLQQAHPAMKKIIVDAVIDVVFKPNNEHNAQYYSVTTLNQTILTRKDEELANSLIKTYFALFEKILVETDHHNVDSKEDKSIGKVEIGRKNNRKNFKKGKKGGKSVKQQEKPENEIVQEKNSKLFSALLTGLNRAFPFSNLPNETYEKHLDTLFKITHSSNFNTSIQALVLVHHIISQQQLNSDRYYRTLYESLLDPRLVTTSKQGIYLNLLFKSLKQDTDVARISAFVKRILQICCHWLNIGSIAGMLFLLMELSKTVPQIQDLMIDFASRPDPEEDQSNVDEKDNKNNNEYDSRKRDPKHANADKSSLWELNQFIYHYHPTVSIYASSLLEGKQQPKPDLGLFSLAHFLDRFVYKNSKEKPVTKGSSIMQPLGGAHTGSLLVKATNVLSTDIPANTENWLSKRSEDIKPDEMFFHQYFTSKVSKLKSKKQDNDTKQDDDDEEDGNLQDDEIWQALVKSKPEVEDDGSEDDGFSDLDEADFDDMSDLSDASDNDEDAEEEIDNDAQDSEDENDDDIQMNGFDKEEESIFGINEDDEVSDSELEIRMIHDEDEDEEEDEEETISKKRSKNSSKKSKKPKVKELPVFASVDDYSQYLNSDDDDFS